jgi:hypothetical protein
MTARSTSMTAESIASRRSDRQTLRLVLAAWALLLILIGCLAAGQSAPCEKDDPMNPQMTCVTLGP